MAQGNLPPIADYREASQHGIGMMIAKAEGRYDDYVLMQESLLTSRDWALASFVVLRYFLTEIGRAFKLTDINPVPVLVGIVQGETADDDALALLASTLLFRGLKNPAAAVKHFDKLPVDTDWETLFDQLCYMFEMWADHFQRQTDFSVANDLKHVVLEVAVGPTDSI